MGRKIKITLVALVIVAATLFGLRYVTLGTVQVLVPMGEIAQQEKDLFWLATWWMLIVIIPVFFASIFIAWRYRASNKKAVYDPTWDNSYIAEFIWWMVPFIIITVLSVYTWKSCHTLNPFKPIKSDVAPIKIQVVALQWKWLFIYPEHNIATVNFVQFPVNTPLNFEVTADAPMNSFWIPQLGSQIYAMPGMRAKVHLIAHKEGTFFGTSANLSGEGFAGMKFQAKASTNAEFNEWVQQVQQSPQLLNLSTYDALAKPSMNNPPAFYLLQKNDLFDSILMKYMMPMDK